MEVINDLIHQFEARLPPDVLPSLPWALALGFALFSVHLMRRNARLKRKVRRLDPHESLRVRRHLTL